MSGNCWEGVLLGRKVVGLGSKSAHQEQAYPLNSGCSSFRALAYCVNGICIGKLREESKVSLHLNECFTTSKNSVFVSLNRSQIHISSLGPT